MEGYCVRCKAKSEMKDPVAEKTKRGGFMAKGGCSKCGTKMCKIMSKDTAEKSVASGEIKKGY